MPTAAARISIACVTPVASTGSDARSAGATDASRSACPACASARTASTCSKTPATSDVRRLVRTLPRPAAAAARGRAHAARPLRPRPVDRRAVDGDVDLLVEEADEPGDRRRVGQRLLVGPDDVALVADGPVRREALVRADRDRVAPAEAFHRDVAAREVVARRQPGLEGDRRAAAVGQQLAADLDADVARAAATVDAVPRVARMAEDLLVLLQPAVERLPAERDVAGEVGIGVAPGGVLRDLAAGGDVPERRAAAVRVRERIGAVAEEVAPHAGVGERVDRDGAARLPHEDRGAAVGNGLAAELRAHALGRRLEAQIPGERLRDAGGHPPMVTIEGSPRSRRPPVTPRLRSSPMPLIADLVAAELAASGDLAHVVRAVFPAPTPAGVADAVEGFCERALGAPVAGAEFFAASVGSVHGLRLRDGRRVVVKVHPPRASVAYLEAMQSAQRHLAAAGFPAPAQPAPPPPLGPGSALAETLLDRGEPPDGHDPAQRRAMAAGLAELVALARPLTGLDGLRQSIMAVAPGALWPRPHDDRFDFAATARGAEWIDRIATVARDPR